MPATDLKNLPHRFVLTASGVAVPRVKRPSPFWWDDYFKKVVLDWCEQCEGRYLIFRVDLIPSIWANRAFAHAFELPEDAIQFKLGHPEWIDSAVLVNSQAADASSHFKRFTNGDAMLERWIQHRRML